MSDLRHLIVILGDQLNLDASAFDDFDPQCDAVWMAEVAQESTHVWSSQTRIVMFLAAMRHFAQALRNSGRVVHYTALDDPTNQQSLATQLHADIQRLQPRRVIMTEPGDWRVLQAMRDTERTTTTPFSIREDRHFYCSIPEFAAHARGRKSLRMEFFYRAMRTRHKVLMQPQDPRQPEGGQWNFDAENRESFGTQGPGLVPERATFPPDAITQEVMALVQRRFKSHPGELTEFAWPVTRANALSALDRFVTERLPRFGPYQDAMWPGEPWLFHAHVSAALNLKLLNPREVIHAAVSAYQTGAAPLASVEGFVRQILGWREYVRGIYWTRMPEYAESNALCAHEDLPIWYWTGQTDMTCMRDAITQTLRFGYAHHIQRLMVTGLFALMYGVAPHHVHAWYLAVYVDAVEWVELPNTLGMSQYADGGLMASKPYIATGKYIQRMSPYCQQCRYDPAQRTGPIACPMTTLYWDFLMRHEALLTRNPRMALQVKNIARIDALEKRAIQAQAQALRSASLAPPPATHASSG
jgi:deoxyribodipyrimidine photolyase-related protein